MDQIEWGDYWIRQIANSKIMNPIGFYIYLIKENIHPPEPFETSRKKALFEKAKQARERQIEKQTVLELAYDDYRAKALESYISRQYSDQEYKALVEKKRQEMLHQHHQMKYWKPDVLTRFLKGAMRSDLEEKLPLQSFESFCRHHTAKGII
jgi:hypothetical protein